MLPLGQSHFWPQDYNLNKLARGLLDDTTYKYQGSSPCGFRQEYFFQIAPYISLCKTCDPRGWATFGPWLSFVQT